MLQKADKEKVDMQENLNNLHNKIENFEKEKANMTTEIEVCFGFSVLSLILIT